MQKEKLSPGKTVPVEDPRSTNRILDGFAHPNGHDQATFLGATSDDDLSDAAMSVSMPGHQYGGDTYVILPDDFCGEISDLESVQPDNDTDAGGVAFFGASRELLWFRNLYTNFSMSSMNWIIVSILRRLGLELDKDRGASDLLNVSCHNVAHCGRRKEIDVLENAKEEYGERW